jgi:broad specificity phosphatase PhoE
MGALILVRHPQVAKRWHGRCYGRTDVGLSRQGRAGITALLERLSGFRPEVIIHSGAQRAAAIADPLARSLGLEAQSQLLWAERDFGTWEGMSWQRIWRETGNAMEGMLSDPAEFRPGLRGETTVEMVRRTLIAMRKIASDERTLIVSHGGPIAAARMLAGKANFDDLPKLIIAPGAHVQINPTALHYATNTPCIGLCQTDESGKLCTGCLRSCDEITRWGSLDITAQQRLIETINKRRVDPS